MNPWGDPIAEPEAVNSQLYKIRNPTRKAAELGTNAVQALCFTRLYGVCEARGANSTGQHPTSTQRQHLTEVPASSDLSYS